MNAHQTRVLVVDDVEQNLTAMQALLARPGLEVLTARSGPDALELLLVHEVAVALVDVRMPGMDGFELAELMRGAPRTRHVPLIFLTAAPQDQQRSFRGYEAGAVDFLHKPVDPQVILSKVKVFVDLDSQKRQLAEQMAELRQALQINEMFTAVLSHDLRTPLSAVRLGAELLLRLSTDETARAAAARIKSSGARMSRMIEQLLDVSRLRSGAMKLRYQQADLAEVCAQIAAEFTENPRQTPLRIEPLGDLNGSFDVDRMSQVLSNVLGNALEHGDAGGEVLVTLDGRDEDTLKVKVNNPGVIPEEVIDLVFEPFRGSNESAAGLGLGLYIVDQFVRAHRGVVRASSSAEHGTSVLITFPRNGAGLEAPGTAPAPLPQLSVPPSLFS
ncbi:hybrid sensor histidine kinase/response regulator [Aquabacterium sp. A7-Y]|uniref:hybrid sensor histidine kinase/response regulator n=1 Tax=Aquabacterium sp. A7-Y TaxID=1349605 RepID=UPI00223E294C|nr:hybrid sensor histidine kinase/response regulator [Aquabacterium sp. A7-Y]MCW7541574.1 hybrid sensor histidine kinase/response regulator [Aquabacterium sp. A7-Y]